MVNESERVWKSIDEFRKTITELCDRTARIEQYILDQQRVKNRNIGVVSAIIAAVVTGINMVFNHVNST